MGWKTINGRQYLYGTVRVAGKQKTVYVGCGPTAQEHDRQIRLRKQERDNERAAFRDAVAAIREIQAQTRSTAKDTDLLIRASLVAAGYYQHDRGQWRVRRCSRVR